MKSGKLRVVGGGERAGVRNMIESEETERELEVERYCHYSRRASRAVTSKLNRRVEVDTRAGRVNLVRGGYAQSNWLM